MRLYLIEDVLWDELLFALILIVGGFIVGKIVYAIFHSIFARIAKKTKTNLDDMIVDSLKRPAYMVVVLIGLFIGIRNLSVLAPYLGIINSVFWIVFALTGLWVLKKLLDSVMDWYSSLVVDRGSAGVDSKVVPVIKRILHIVLYVILFIIILDNFDIEISPLIASLGVASLAVALALQETLSNFFAGMYIMADRPIQVGDYIKFDNTEEGYVQHIGWRSTRIKKLGNNMVIVPNSKLANAVIKNYDRPKSPLSVVTYCGVSYDSDLDMVEKVAYKAAVKTRDEFEGAYDDYDPLIRFYEFGDSNINFKIIIRANTYVDRFRLQHELIKNLKKAFDKEKIEISWPVRKVYDAGKV